MTHSAHEAALALAGRLPDRPVPVAWEAWLLAQQLGRDRCVPLEAGASFLGRNMQERLPCTTLLFAAALSSTAPARPPSPATWRSQATASSASAASRVPPGATSTPRAAWSRLAG